MGFIVAVEMTIARIETMDASFRKRSESMEIEGYVIKGNMAGSSTEIDGKDHNTCIILDCFSDYSGMSMGDEEKGEGPFPQYSPNFLLKCGRIPFESDGMPPGTNSRGWMRKGQDETGGRRGSHSPPQNR